ncbi:MAG: HD domain-containing protein [Romboutsia sp.]|nr:HD domain-containing protein [Romboutsia sp.]
MNTNNKKNLTNKYKKIEEEIRIDVFNKLEESSIKCLYKDKCTYEHTLRVKEYCIMIGNKVNLNSQELDSLAIAAEFHDIGKIEIDDKVLLKKSNLNDEEYEYIKKHTELGYDLMKYLVDKNIALVIKHHHERLNGTGYPDRLKGNEINEFAKIIAVADSYDAMVSDRPYHKGITSKEAINELEKNTSTLFEEKYVIAMKEILIELKELE